MSEADQIVALSVLKRGVHRKRNEDCEKGKGKGGGGRERWGAREILQKIY